MYNVTSIVTITMNHPYNKYILILKKEKLVLYYLIHPLALEYVEEGAVESLNFKYICIWNMLYKWNTG
jgi:hypothetical protein